MIKDFDLITDTARHDNVPMFAVALIRQQSEEALARSDGQKGHLRPLRPPLSI